MGIQVKIDCPRLLVPFTYKGNQNITIDPPRIAADPWWFRGGQMSRIAGSSEQFNAGVSGLVKIKPRLYYLFLFYMSTTVRVCQIYVAFTTLLNFI